VSAGAAAIGVGLLMGCAAGVGLLAWHYLRPWQLEEESKYGRVSPDWRPHKRTIVRVE